MGFEAFLGGGRTDLPALAHEDDVGIGLVAVDELAEALAGLDRALIETAEADLPADLLEWLEIPLSFPDWVPGATADNPDDLPERLPPASLKKALAPLLAPGAEAKEEPQKKKDDEEKAIRDTVRASSGAP